MIDNKFSLLYKTWATTDLVVIVENYNDYQPLAVEAAKLEIDSRQLNTEQLNDIKLEIAARQRHKELKGKVIEKKAKALGASFFDTLRPIPKEPPSTNKIIYIILFFFTLIIFYQISSQFFLFSLLLKCESIACFFGILVCFVPPFVAFVIGVLFWQRKKLGWILAISYFSFTTAGTISTYLSVISHNSTGYQPISSGLPVVTPTLFISTLFIFGGLTIVLCKNDIREVYRGEKKSMYLAIIFGIALVVLITFLRSL